MAFYISPSQPHAWWTGAEVEHGLAPHDIVLVHTFLEAQQHWFPHATSYPVDPDVQEHTRLHVPPPYDQEDQEDQERQAERRNEEILGCIRKPSDSEFGPHVAGFNGSSRWRNRSPKAAIRGS